MDPQQRLLLEQGYSALHSGKHRRATLEGSITGVFLGILASDFSGVLAASPAGNSVYASTSAVASVASGRLSYTLGLNGSCVSYDTACSAALVACHGGLQAVRAGECCNGLV